MRINGGEHQLHSETHWPLKNLLPITNRTTSHSTQADLFLGGTDHTIVYITHYLLGWPNVHIGGPCFWNSIN